MHGDQHRASAFNKIGFLTQAPNIEMEFLISKQIVARCYRVNNYVLVAFAESRRQIWTELIHGALIEVPEEKVMSGLTIEQRKEFVENWSLLRKKEDKPKEKI
jgi:hypothetical protein